MPRFSIIIPTFNPGDKLALSLESVRAQNFAEVEIWVIDGASTDGTVEWLERNAEILGVQWLSEPDSGIYDAMNRGIARSTGEFLYFLGAGDQLRPEILHNISAQVPSQGEMLRFVYGDMALPDGTNYDGPFTLSKLRTQNIGHQAIFYDKRLFERLGGYETQYRSFADHIFNMKCWGNREVVPTYCSIVIADYEGGGSSNSGDSNYDRDRMRLVKQHLGTWQYFLALIAKAIPTMVKQSLRNRGKLLRSDE